MHRGYPTKSTPSPRIRILRISENGFSINSRHPLAHIQRESCRCIDKHRGEGEGGVRSIPFTFSFIFYMLIFF